MSKFETALSKFKPNRDSALLSERDESVWRASFGTMIPDWYYSLLRSYPLIGTTFDYRLSDETDSVHWLSAADSIEESLDFYPGLLVRQFGFVPVAGCATGSGDPYFIRFDSEDPALVQVYHDVNIQTEADMKHGSKVVAKSLTEFFASCEF